MRPPRIEGRRDYNRVQARRQVMLLTAQDRERFAAARDPIRYFLPVVK
jgi:hypothetical protein